MSNELKSTTGNFVVSKSHSSLDRGQQAIVGATLFPIEDKIKTQVKELINKNADDVETLLFHHLTKEDKAYNNVYNALQKWVKEAELTSTYVSALKWHKQNKKVLDKDHSNNKWISTGLNSSWSSTKSNRVYKMGRNVNKMLRFNNETYENDIVYHTSWSVWVNGDTEFHIDGEDCKEHNSKEDAYNYLQSIEDKYNYLFESTNPTVPNEYTDLFSKYGIPYDGFNFSC